MPALRVLTTGQRANNGNKPSWPLPWEIDLYRLLLPLRRPDISRLPGDSSVGEPLWTRRTSISVTSLKHWGRSNNNNSKDGVCLWRAEILVCCLKGKSKPRRSCSQSLIDWPYWNHFIVYRCSSSCSLRLRPSTCSIKPAYLDVWKKPYKRIKLHVLLPNTHSYSK